MINAPVNAYHHELRSDAARPSLRPLFWDARMIDAVRKSLIFCQRKCHRYMLKKSNAMRYLVWLLLLRLLFRLKQAQTFGHSYYFPSSPCTARWQLSVYTMQWLLYQKMINNHLPLHLHQPWFRYEINHTRQLLVCRIIILSIPRGRAIRSTQEIEKCRIWRCQLRWRMALM